MDPDLARLLAIPGTDDLTVPDAADVLRVSVETIKRNCKSGELENKRHTGRGKGVRNIRIPRAAIVRYLLKITKGDQAALRASIAAQCPQYLQVAQGVQPLCTGDADTPANVLCIKTGKRRGKPKPADPYAGHPDLFNAATA